MRIDAVKFLHEVVNRNRSVEDWARAAAALLSGVDDGDRRADLRMRFEERAGIAQFDGGLDRMEAERLAYKELVQTMEGGR
jgi:hypothetical protein